MTTWYEYMVTYAFQTGNGRVFITRSEPINRPSAVEGIERDMTERNNFKCALTGFYLLRTYEASEPISG